MTLTQSYITVNAQPQSVLAVLGQYAAQGYSLVATYPLQVTDGKTTEVTVVLIKTV